LQKLYLAEFGTEKILSFGATRASYLLEHYMQSKQDDQQDHTRKASIDVLQTEDANRS
jgi:hypothetical protein